MQDNNDVNDTEEEYLLHDKLNHYKLVKVEYIFTPLSYMDV